MDNSIRNFWDGGLLSNTPLTFTGTSTILSEVKNMDKIPDLDVYIVNVHLKKIDIHMLPEYHDVVKDRNNDIKGLVAFNLNIANRTHKLHQHAE